MGTAVGQWLEEALVDLCRKQESDLSFDRDVISGLVSYCDLAQPVDAKEYLDNIIGKSGESIIAEYLHRRGYKEPSSHASNSSGPELQMYVKPKVDYGASSGTKKPFKTNIVVTSSNPLAESNTSRPSS